MKDVAREVELGGKRYWIVSEPDSTGWKAHIVERRPAGSADDLGDEIGIEASGETRTAADAAAERKLRRLLNLPAD